MTRQIVSPAVLPPSALAELKQWLGISTGHDDALLSALLHTALELCERFTGTMPIACECEEVIDRAIGWQTLATRPVQAITALDGVRPNGTRVALSSSDYAIDLDAGGSGKVLVMNPGDASRVAVRFTAGIAADWPSLPDALRHGVIRLAAHQHRERENSGAGPVPPASVAALWRPFRRLRLT